MTSISAEPCVVVLMAVHNGMAWLSEQVDSILEQRGVNVALYISDDGSHDGSKEWCRQLSDINPCVHILDDKGRFGSAAQNFLRLLRDVSIEKYDYIAFSDQDDIWYHDKLLNAVNRLRSESSDGYSSNVRAFWPDGKESLVDKAQEQQAWDYFFEAGGAGCTYLMTRDLALDLKNTLNSKPELAHQLKYHDWLCYAFARGRGYRWYIDAEPSMRYRQHLHNAVGVNSGFNSLLRRVRSVIGGGAIRQIEYTAWFVFDREEDVPIIIPKRRSDFFKLAFAASKCRRRLRDQCYFFCFCILMSVFYR